MGSNKTNSKEIRYKDLFNAERRKNFDYKYAFSWRDALCFQWVMFPVVLGRVGRLYGVGVSELMVIAYVYIETKVKGNPYCRFGDAIRFAMSFKRSRGLDGKAKRLIESGLFKVVAKGGRNIKVYNIREFYVELGAKSTAIIKTFGEEHTKLLRQTKNKYVDLKDVLKDEED